jgi:hypothetical protein
MPVGGFQVLSQAVLPQKISDLIKSDNVNAKEIGKWLAIYKDAYDDAKEKRDEWIVSKWNKIKYEDVVCADNDALLPRALAKLRSHDDTLYIVGHCKAGMQKLMSTADYVDDLTEVISVEGLINILKDKLDPKFEGKIKIFACESGRFKIGTAWASYSASFAQTFATEVSKAGWVNCSFWGYGAKLSMYVRDAAGHKLTSNEVTRARDSKIPVTA